MSVNCQLTPIDRRASATGGWWIAVSEPQFASSWSVSTLVLVFMYGPSVCCSENNIQLYMFMTRLSGAECSVTVALWHSTLIRSPSLLTPRWSGKYPHMRRMYSADCYLVVVYIRNSIFRCLNSRLLVGLLILRSSGSRRMRSHASVD